LLACEHAGFGMSQASSRLLRALYQAQVVQCADVVVRRRGRTLRRPDALKCTGPVSASHPIGCKDRRTEWASSTKGIGSLWHGASPKS
jgi:hypothetical protein